jgi:Mpv17 / PMP22 family
VNWREAIIMTMISAAYTTPMLLIFYHFLNKVKSNSLVKLFIDQFIFSPIFTCSIIALRFFLLDSNLTITDVVNLTIKIAPSAMTYCWLFWIPQRYFTLNYVPGMYQVMFGSICGFVWNIIFSMVVGS